MQTHTQSPHRLNSLISISMQFDVFQAGWFMPPRTFGGTPQTSEIPPISFGQVYSSITNPVIKHAAVTQV